LIEHRVYKTLFLAVVERIGDIKIFANDAAGRDVRAGEEFVCSRAQYLR
jgi:hypothetical protein